MFGQVFYLFFFLPLPDFLPPEEPSGAESPLPLGLAFIILYLLFFEEKDEPLLFFSFFLETEWVYSLLFDLVRGGFEEYIFGPFFDFPENESLVVPPLPLDLFVADAEPFFFFQNCACNSFVEEQTTNKPIIIYSKYLIKKKTANKT